MFKGIHVSSIFTALDDANELRPDLVISFTRETDQVHDTPTFNLPSDDILVFPHVDDVDVHTDINAPNDDMVRKIFGFIDNKRKTMDKKPTSFPSVLIHCIGGVSRSTAAGIALMVDRGASIDDAVREMHVMRPNVAPNVLILQLFSPFIFGNNSLDTGVRKSISKLDRRMSLWCSACQKHFFDGDGCGGQGQGHWT